MLLSIGQIFSSANQTLSSAFGLQKSKAEALFEKALFAQGPALPKSSKILSGHTMGNASVVSDYTSLYRSVQDLAVGIWNAFPHAPFCFLKEFMLSKDIALGYHAFGSVSSLNAVIGLVQLKGAFDSCALAKAVDDDFGLLQGRLSYLQAGTLFGAGVSFAAYRPLSMYGVAKDLPSTSLIGRLSYATAQAGMAFYGLFFTFLTAMFGLQVHEGMTFVKGLDRAGDLTAQVDWLQKMLRVDPQTIHQKLIDDHGKDKATELLIDEAISAGKQSVRSMMKEMGIAGFQEAKLEEIVRDAVKKSCSGWTAGAVQKNMNEKLKLVGLSMRVQKTQLKQTIKMQRILGKSGFETLKEVASLKGRVSKTNAHAQALVDKVRASAVSKITENAFVGAVCAMGVVAMIAATICTGGVPLIVSSAIMLVFSILMSVIDAYNLYLSYKEERPAPYDKQMVIFSTIVGMASLLTLIALGATGVVSMGIFPMVVAAILSALWIGQNAVTMMVMNRNESHYQLKNPTLEIFLKALQDDGKKDKIMEMFGNLPEELKGQIQKALKWHQNDMKKAALSVAQKIEQAKKERFELLRLALSPHLVTESVK